MRIKTITHSLLAISLLAFSSATDAAEKTKVENYDAQGKSIGVRASSGKKKKEEKI